jgi:hypothetical protein
MLATFQWHQSFRKKQLMIVMMREERCASDGLLLERKKKNPLNLLQRLGLIALKKQKFFNNYFNCFY